MHLTGSRLVFLQANKMNYEKSALHRNDCTGNFQDAEENAGMYCC